MTTTVNLDLVRAAMVGRIVPQSIRASIRIATVNTPTGGTTIASLSSVSVLFFHREYIVGQNAYIADEVAIGLRSSLLFPSVSLTGGSTYYVVATTVATSKLTWMPENMLLWTTSFVAPTTLTSQLLLFTYTDNIVGTI